MKRKPNHLWRSALTLLLALAMVAPFIVLPPEVAAEDVAIDYGWDGGTLTDDGTGNNNVLSVSADTAVSEKFTVYQGFSYTATAEIVGEGAIDIVFYDKDGALLTDTTGASSTGSTDETAPFGATQAVISLSATGTATFDNITIEDNTVVANGSTYMIPLVNGNFNDSSARQNKNIYNSTTHIPGWGTYNTKQDSGDLTGSYYRIQPQTEDPSELHLFAQVGTAPTSDTDPSLPAPYLYTLSRIPIAPGLTYSLSGLAKKMSGDATNFVYRLYAYNQAGTRLGHKYTFIDYPTSTDFASFSGSIDLDNTIYQEYPTAASVELRLIMSRATINVLFDDLVLQVSGYTAPVLTNGTLDDDYAAISGKIPNNNLSYHYSKGTLTLSATDDTKPALIPSSDQAWVYEYVNRENITKIVIGDNIDAISDNAFVDCTQLNEIVLSNDLRTIGQKAFACTQANGTELTITVPKQVQTLPANAFENRTNVQMTVWYASPTVSFAAPGVTTTVKGSVKILFIGNSLSDDASDMRFTGTSYLYNMLRSQADPNIEVAVGLCYNGGKMMEWHADQAVNNGQQYEFYYLADGMTKKRELYNYSSKDALMYDDWDIVVLQPYRYDAEDINVLRPSLVTMLDHIQKYQPYSTCLLEMIWPRNLQNAGPEHERLSATHQAALSITSTDGEYNVDGVVPVGTAVSSVLTTYILDLSYNTDAESVKPVTDPQNAILRDEVHISFNVGRYLTGYMFARYIIGDEWSTEKEIPLRNSLTIGVLPEEYRTIITTAANAALATPFAPINMSNDYDVDPARLAQAFLSQNAVPVSSEWQTEDELKELIENAVIAKLAGIHDDYHVKLLDLPSYTAPNGTAAGSYTANFEVRFGYTTVTASVSGSIIDLAACTHTPAATWTTDGEYHWKVCTVEGCGVVIESTKAQHVSTGANVATCQKQAVCDVCNVSYGDFAGHDWNTSTWEKDETGHWHKCNTVGCTEKNDFAGHTPDHEGNATEEYAIKCSICLFEIEAQLNHVHVFDKEVAEEQHLASKANCTDPAKYYKSCKCGENGTETFNVGNKLGHTEGTEWQKDATGHWHTCTVAGCGVVIDSSKATHTPDHQGGATEEYAILCSDCGYEIEAQLEHVHVFDKEVAEEQHLASKANCTDPAKYYKSCKCGENGTETFNVGEKLDHTEGTAWEKDATGHWHICTAAGCGVVIDSSKAAHTPDHQGGATEEYAILCSDCGYEIEAQLEHVHVFDKEVAEEQHLASKANCTDPAKYYKSCKCGENGTETFNVGNKLEHTEGTEWKSDEDNHWHECSVAGCGFVIENSKAAHTPDREAATENDPIKCSVCDYVITPALGHTHAHGTDWKSNEDNHWNECACGDKANVAAHKDDNEDGSCDVCGYNVGIPSVPSDNPKTGENSMMLLWMSLLLVSGLGIIATTALRKKSVR